MPTISVDFTSLVNHEAWKRIAPLLPSKTPQGFVRTNDRHRVAAILHVLYTGSRWRDVPPSLGSPVEAFSSYQCWRKSEVWDQVWSAYLSTLAPKTRRRWEQRAAAHGAASLSPILVGHEDWVDAEADAQEVQRQLPEPKSGHALRDADGIPGKGLRPGWVSVVMPTYNRASRLEASINSCLTQEHEAVEVIVVDDGSTDDTQEVLAELQRRWGPTRLRVAYQPNQGACAARNVGMDLAEGEYLQLLDSDDLLRPQKLSRQVAALQETGAAVAVCDIVCVRDDGAYTPFREIRYNRDLRAGLAKFRHASIPTLLIRRQAIPSLLRWNTKLMRYQDVDFVVRCLLSVDSWTYTPGLDVLYVHHEGPQITDTYSEGRQHREMFDGLSDYWDQAQALIPRQNHTLVRQAAAALAWNSAVDGQGADARAMLRFAAAGPGALSRARAIVPPLVLSLVSPKTLAAARRAKRWLRERQGAMGVAPS